MTLCVCVCVCVHVCVCVSQPVARHAGELVGALHNNNINSQSSWLPVALHAGEESEPSHAPQTRSQLTEAPQGNCRWLLRLKG